MKKIFSLVIVAVMMFAMANVSFAANDYTVTMELTDVAFEPIDSIEELPVGDSFYVNLYIDNIPDNIRAATIKLSYDKSLVNVEDFTNEVFSDQAISKRGTWAVSGKDDAEGAYISYMGDAVSTGTYVFDPEIAMVTVGFVKVADSGTAVIKTTLFSLTDASLVDYTTANFPELSLVLGGDDDSNIVATSNREAVTEKATHQIGTAVGMTVTVPEGIAFQKMIWVIANGSERLYAKEIVDLSDIPVAGDIKVAATFVNGSHNDVYKDAEVVAPLTIGKNDFDAIFRGVDADKNEADYFTNAADKAE